MAVVATMSCDPAPSQVDDATPPAPEAFSDTSPRFTPDGESIVFVREQQEDSDIVMLPLADSDSVEILADLSEFDYDPAVGADGTVLFSSSPNGFAQLHTTTLAGDAAQPLSELTHGWATYPAWSPDGDEIVYACGRPVYEESDICVMTAKGKLRGSTEPRSSSLDVQPTWAPDGSSIVFSSDRSGDRDLFTVDLESFEVEQLTEGPESDGDPMWSPDGSSIAFTRGTAGSPMVCILEVRSSDVRCVTEGIQPAWSPDGGSLVFYRETPAGSRIFTSNIDGTGVVAIT